MTTHDTADSHPIPLGLKIAYTAWMVLWVPVVWTEVGPANFLWFCDIANFVVLLALWRQSPLLFSSQATGVLFIQLIWNIDFAGGLLFGTHVIGGTEYMFDSEQWIVIRALSTFHIWIPLLLIWALRRYGYDRRGLLLQVAIAWVVLPLSLLPDPERNLNWVWEPFGQAHSLPPGLYLLISMVAYPLIVCLPTHLLLARLLPPARRTREDRPMLGSARFENPP